MGECPSCLDTGEDFTSKKKKNCILCSGKGQVDIDVANGYINNLSYEVEELI